MSLVTKEDVKHFLQYEKDSNDGLIDSLIARVEADFKEFIGGAAFDASDSSYTEYTEYYDGDGKSILFLKKRPVRSITSIHIDPDRAYTADKLVSAGDIILYSDAAYVQLNASVFSWGPQSVKVIYKAGYKASDAPADFKQIIVNEVVADLLEGVGAINVVEESEFFYRPDKLRKESARLKQKYKAIL